MDRRRRILLSTLPLLGGVAYRHVWAQPNVNTPSSTPGQEQGGEVQVGAGTQGDVTTGSSGTKPKSAPSGDTAASNSNIGASSNSAQSNASNNSGSTDSSGRDRQPPHAERQRDQRNARSGS